MWEFFLSLSLVFPSRRFRLRGFGQSGLSAQPCSGSFACEHRSVPASGKWCVGALFWGQFLENELSNDCAGAIAMVMERWEGSFSLHLPGVFWRLVVLCAAGDSDSEALAGA